MVLNEDNKIVHGLWIGNRLSAIEMLTLHSFTDKGHIFYLWVYEPIDNKLPENVVLKDANELIPASGIYRRKHNDPQFKIGKGSVGSPFSDLFRYKLLYEFGGWWVDMDVTCLQPLNLDEPYFFRAHPLIPMIGNVMKVPAKSELMRLTYEEVNETCNENTIDWLLPNKILNKFVFELELQKYIREDLSASDWWEKVEKFIHTNKRFPEKWLFIHWMNEEWRTREIDKSKIFAKTSIGNLAEKYGFQTQPNSIIERIKRTLKYSFR